MKAQKLAAVCSAVLFILVEAMAFGGSAAANAQGVPQLGGGNSAGSPMDFRDNGNGRRRGRHKKHRKHRKGNRGAHQGRNGGGQRASRRDPWGNINPQGAGSMDGGGGHRKRHKRHRGGRKRGMMQMDGNG